MSPATPPFAAAALTSCLGRKTDSPEAWSAASRGHRRLAVAAQRVLRGSETVWSVDLRWDAVEVSLQGEAAALRRAIEALLPSLRDETTLLDGIAAEPARPMSPAKCWSVRRVSSDDARVEACLTQPPIDDAATEIIRGRLAESVTCVSVMHGRREIAARGSAHASLAVSIERPAPMFIASRRAHGARQVIGAVAYPEFGASEYPIATIAAHTLGGFGGSILAGALRSRGLSYIARSAIRQHRGFAYLLVQADTLPENEDRVVKEIAEVFTEIPADSFGAALDAARRYSHTMVAMVQSDPASAARFSCDTISRHLDPDAVLAAVQDKTSRATAEELAEFWRQTTKGPIGDVDVS